MADLVRHESSNDVLTVYPGGRVNLAGGQLQAAGVNLIPPPSGTPDGDVLTAKASAPGGVAWEQGGASVPDAFKIGACILLVNMALANGSTTQIVINPQGGTIDQQWVNGFTFNDTNDGLIATVKGRYQITGSIEVTSDPSLDLYWALSDGQSLSDGVMDQIPHGITAGNLTRFYTGVCEIDVGGEIDFFATVKGADSTMIRVELTVQYVGPATSI